MRLLRHGPPGAEEPGLLDRDGVIRDLSKHVSDITEDTLGDSELARIAALNTRELPAIDGNTRLGVPFTGTRQFIAVGLNFTDHAAESNMSIPTEPVLFTKAVSCIHGPNDPVRKPRGSTKMDWEVELGIVIGKQASYVSEADALKHVAGYVVIDDLSERAFQLERGGTWDKGKGCPTFGPVGPWLVTRDEVPDPQSLDMWLDVNGERMQTGTTSRMIFGCATLVSYISQFITLLPGDIITTGTPPGVGMGKSPPRYLEVGDTIELGIESLGSQKHRVVE